MDKMKTVLQGCVDCEDYGKGEYRHKLDFLSNYEEKISKNDLYELEEHIVKLVSEKEKKWFDKGYNSASKMLQ